MSQNLIRVQLIDDDHDDYSIIREMLAEGPHTKFHLDWVSTFEEGIEAIQSAQHDVYLVDYRLGPQTGLDLLDRARELNCQRPIILMTGYGDHEVDLEAMKRGASDYLVKGQINSLLLERSIRYSIKHMEDLQNLQEQEAHIRMQDRLASVGLLASSVAHEIGTPLGIMRGRIELLAKQLRDNPGVKENTDVIVAQIDRISTLIRSLLNLARDNKAGRPGVVILNNAINDVLNLMGHEFRKNSITVESLLNAPIHIKAEPAPLHQVLLNLLVNAVHAIEEAKKNSRKNNHFIRLALKENPSDWVLSIEDTGCGVSKQNMKNLFRPFFTTKELGAGTGLGLVTSYNIVKSWGGSIQVESQEGVGSRFKVLLPKA